VEYAIVPTTKTAAAARAISWWEENIPATVMIPAVRAFTRGAATALQVQFHTQANISASIVRP